MKKYLIITDCDGVLTDNKCYYDKDGNQSIAFNKSDGLVIADLKQTPNKIIVLTGSFNYPTDHRMRHLGIKYIASPNKLNWISTNILNDTSLNSFGVISNGIYKDFTLVLVGNDYNDIGMLSIDNAKSYIPNDAIIDDTYGKKLKRNGGDGVIAELIRNELEVFKNE